MVWNINLISDNRKERLVKEKIIGFLYGSYWEEKNDKDEIGFDLYGCKKIR